MIYRDISHDTVIQGKTSHITDILEREEKILSFEIAAVFHIQNGFLRSQFSTFNTWLKSATPNFEFQGFVNSSPIKSYWGIY